MNRDISQSYFVNRSKIIRKVKKKAEKIRIYQSAIRYIKTGIYENSLDIALGEQPRFLRYFERDLDKTYDEQAIKFLNGFINDIIEKSKRDTNIYLYG